MRPTGLSILQDEHIEGFKEKLTQLGYTLETIGVTFDFVFQDAIHDRSIVLNNGWKIVMRRGLDIWQKTNGWFDQSEFVQEKRQCKACEITYLK